MNILMVLSSGKFPPDRRVEREARDLIEQGHNVFLMARRGPGQSREENVDGVHVLRVPLAFQSKQIFADLVYYFFQRFSIIFHILRACRKHKIAALHVHDLPYALTTVVAGKILGIPVTFDMHEHYTAMMAMGFEARAYRLVRPFSFLLLAIMRIEEKYACRWATQIVVVADEQIPRLEKLKVSPDKIIVVTNTEDAGFFAGLNIDQEIIDRYKDDFVILYTGGFSPHRGLDTAINAMPGILEVIPNARLLLVGEGVSRSELEAQAGELNLKNRVIFTGFQPFKLLPTYIEASAVGLIPHVSTPHIETTMPNKIFQFMILGKPVIVSSTRPMMRVVEDAACGVIFKERDPGSLAEAVLRLRDQKLRNELGLNGKAAVDDRYHWQQSVKPLLEFYNSFPNCGK